MNLLGAVGLGLVVGWVVPSARRPTWIAFVTTVAMLVAVAAAIGLWQGTAAAMFSTAASVAAAWVHATWRAYLARSFRGQAGQEE